MFTFSATSTGFERIERLLEGNELTQKPWRNALERAASQLHALVRSGAPVGGTGQTRSQTFHKVHAAAVPRYIVVGTKAARSGQGGRVSYPFILANQRSRHWYHWLQNVLRRSGSVLSAELDSAAREIEAKWSGA